METWVVVSVVIVAVAIVFQAAMLAMMFVQMRKTVEQRRQAHHRPALARRPDSHARSNPARRHTAKNHRNGFRRRSRRLSCARPGAKTRSRRQRSHRPPPRPARYRRPHPHRRARNRRRSRHSIQTRRLGPDAKSFRNHQRHQNRTWTSCDLAAAPAAAPPKKPTSKTAKNSSFSFHFADTSNFNEFDATVPIQYGISS